MSNSSPCPLSSQGVPSAEREKSRRVSVVGGMILSFAASISFGRYQLLILCLFLTALIITPTQLSAQNQVQIMRADSIVGGTIQGAPVQKILGNVHLRTEEIEMFADTAYKFSNQEKVQAFGNIEIITREENIFTDSLTYYTDIDYSELRGRVIIESDSATFFGNSVDYRFTNKVAHFIDEIRLEDQRGTLVANSGFYFREPDSATFVGQVQLRDSLQYIEGDSLFSNRQSEYYELHGNVFADDPENSSMLKGDYLEADSTGRRLLQGNAWLKNYKQDSTATEPPDTDSLQIAPPDPTKQFKPDSLQPSIPDTTLQSRPDSLRSPPADATAQTPADSLGPLKLNPIPAPADSAQTTRNDTTETSQPDTTHIRATRILSLENRSAEDTTSTIKAFENVRIWSPNFSSLSDTSQYESKTQTFELWSNAKAWNEQTQLTGPYIWVKLQNGDIKQLDSYPNPFSVQQDTVINRLNQIKGDTLQATFEEGQLRLIRVFQNSHLLRFTEKEGRPDGALDLTAPVTFIYFENGRLAELKSLGKEEAIDGNYLPETPKVAEKKLDGFSWNPELRPQEPREIMAPRFPPIPEDPMFELPRRYLEYIGRNDSLRTAPQDTLQTPADSLQSQKLL